MKIIGIDFTSRPTDRRPITCVRCSLKENLLSVETLELWPSFTPFEAALVTPGPWIAGIDFPFGQSRNFIENIGWPRSWADYVRHANELGRDEFRKALDNYRQRRAWRDKEHQRKTDTAAGSISPQKLYGVPVGLMFFKGAHRLLRSGVMIPQFNLETNLELWSKLIRDFWRDNSSVAPVTKATIQKGRPRRNAMRGTTCWTT